MATSPQIEDQPRKLIDRRRVVEMKMQEDEALFNDIMRAIEPCFRLVSNQVSVVDAEDATVHHRRRSSAASDDLSSSSISRVKNVQHGSCRSSHLARTKPYSGPWNGKASSMMAMEMATGGEVAQRGSAAAISQPSQPMERTIRVSVIRHAPPSASPPTISPTVVQ